LQANFPVAAKRLFLNIIHGFYAPPPVVAVKGRYELFYTLMQT